MKIAAVLVVALCALPLSASAQGVTLYAHAQLDASRRPSLRINTNVTYANLVFLRKADLYEAKYRVVIRLEDARSEKLVDSIVLSESVVVGQYDDTKSRKKSSAVTHRFFTPPGDYLVRAELWVDNTQIAYRKEARVSVPDFFESGVSITAPQLFATVEDTTRFVHPLQRAAGFRGVPKEHDLFAEANRQPALRFDVYTKDQEAVACNIVYEVVTPTERQVFYGKKAVDLNGRGDEFVVVFNVDEWEPGDYIFNVKAVTADDVSSTATSYRFSLEFTRSMLLRNFDKTLEILSLIGSADEVKELRSAAEADRADVWMAFWKDRDPTPNTEKNEALEEHMRRVRYVSSNFSGVEAGWRSDRGKVYIRYGQPDEIEVRSDPYFQGEYLVWRYIKENLSFVFYDRFGLGEYKLTNTSAF